MSTDNFDAPNAFRKPLTARLLFIWLSIGVLTQTSLIFRDIFFEFRNHGSIFSWPAGLMQSLSFMESYRLIFIAMFLSTIYAIARRSQFTRLISIATLTAIAAGLFIFGPLQPIRAVGTISAALINGFHSFSTASGILIVFSANMYLSPAAKAYFGPEKVTALMNARYGSDQINLKPPISVITVQTLAAVWLTLLSGSLFLAIVCGDGCPGISDPTDIKSIIEQRAGDLMALVLIFLCLATIILIALRSAHARWVGAVCLGSLALAAVTVGALVIWGTTPTSSQTAFFEGASAFIVALVGLHAYVMSWFILASAPRKYHSLSRA